MGLITATCWHSCVYCRNEMNTLLKIALLLLLPMLSFAQLDVKVSGAMKNVKMNGDLTRTISLDTLDPRLNLYGVGPYEALQGEVIIVAGHAYFSTVVSDTEMSVVESYAIKSPFFVHGYVAEWEEYLLPASVTNIAGLETYLDSIAIAYNGPFAFKLSGKFVTANIHIVNLPEGKKIKKPKHAHKGMVKYTLNNVEANIIGFYSTAHKGIFTHHDRNTHMHLLTKDLTKMGHLDEIEINPEEVKLYLPVR